MIKLKPYNYENRLGRCTSRDEYGNADVKGVDMSFMLGLPYEEMAILAQALNRLADFEDAEIAEDKKLREKSNKKMNDDLISRQAAIDEAKEWIDAVYFEENDKRERKAIECFIGSLKNIPSAQPEPRWIPCSERLPEEDGLYLVTSREKATAEEFGFDLDDVEVKKMRFNEDGWRIPKHIPEWINGVVHTTILAWMPLPEPYREERTEE